MRLRMESSVVPWLIVAVAPALALTGGGCGDDFESCETTRTCPAGGKAGSGGNAGDAGSGQAALGGGGTSGTGAGGNGMGGSRTGAAGEGGDGGASGEEGADSAGRGGAGGSSGRNFGDSGSGGEGGTPVEGPDPCESVTCEHGVCTNVDGEGVCDCEPDFTGQRCELPTFEWIDLLPGHDRIDGNSAFLLSENGTVLGRSCQSDDCSATGLGFRWTHQEGTSAFGGSEIHLFTDVNQDASVVVGFSRETLSRYRAFRWTEASGFVNLGILPGGDADSRSGASGVSADGSVVVGYSGGEAFRWTLGSGMVQLALPSGRPSNSSANAIAVSDDGAIIAGHLNLSSSPNVLRWTATGEVEWIEPSRNVWVTEMSADGEVIVGWGEGEAFRWTRLAGIVSLGRPNGCAFTEANAVSGDGRIVAVECSDGMGVWQQYLWDVDSGFRRTGDVLESIGAHVADAGYVGASALSFDGSTMLGYSSSANAHRPWIARFPAARDR
jgi:probable HAF family extracellular repeat protein